MKKYNKCTSIFVVGLLCVEWTPRATDTADNCQQQQRCGRSNNNTDQNGHTEIVYLINK